MGRVAIGLALLLLLANGPSKILATDRSVSTADLRPMRPAEIRKMVFGHALGRGPFAPDTGPMVFTRDGVASEYCFVGQCGISYQIVDNCMILGQRSPYSNLCFYRDKKGRPYSAYRTSPGNSPTLASPLVFDWKPSQTE